ncbi:MAG: helix-turn-helix transcriptional regulator [Clostridia bacterium]|nr:helix-turn-helix transcriptional regulator [Clostridia bacterium]
MQLSLGQKIRELRKRDGRTQENLAEALGVTSQAISRWESNGGYPDMEMLPAIANYFHVSIDELFGYNSDREEKIKSILDKADKVMENQGFHYYQGSISEEVENCINSLRIAADEFPNEPRILLRLANTLYTWGFQKYGLKVDYKNETGILHYDTEYHSQNPYWKESLSAFERLLNSNPSQKDRESAILRMTTLYMEMGKYKEAKELAEAQSSVAIGKEMLMPSTAAGEEMMQYQAERVMALLCELHTSVSNALSSKISFYTSDCREKMDLALINLFETIFEDGRCGAYHQAIGNIYMNLADYESYIAKNFEKALEYFDKGFEHYRKYEQISEECEYSYSAPLVSYLKPVEKDTLRPLGENFWQKEVKHMPEDFKNELRKNKKYAICFE